MNLNLNRYKPKYKYFNRLRENIIWNSKLLRLKKKKWFVLIRRLSFSECNRSFNNSLYQISKNAVPLQKNYKSRLFCKQRLSLHYGVINNKLMKKLCAKALKKNKIELKSGVEDTFLQLLESRLCTVLYKSNFVKSSSSAKQLIAHRNVLVNNKIVINGNFLLKRGDVISLCSKAHSNIKDAAINFKCQTLVPYNLEINFKILTIVFIKRINLIKSFHLFPFWLNLKTLFSFYSL